MLGSALTDTAPAALPFVARDAAADVSSATAFAGVALFMLVAPFERLEPLLRLPAHRSAISKRRSSRRSAAWGSRSAQLDACPIGARP
jgi:hypothetical protein